MHTEHGRNDIFGSRWPALMPNAFRSLAKEKEAKERAKAAMGQEDRQGWVHLDTVAVVSAAAAEGQGENEKGRG